MVNLSTEQAIHQRFTIRWDRESATYRMSIPNYEGGDVIPFVNYLQLLHERDCAVEDVTRLVGKLYSIRARALSLAQWIDKGCAPKHGAIEASFIALMAKEPSDDVPAEPAEDVARLVHQVADHGVRLREAIALVKLYAPTKHWAWIREVESELSDDVPAHQHSFVMGVCSCGERSADYLHY